MNKAFYLAAAVLVLILIIVGYLSISQSKSTDDSADQQSQFNTSQLEDANNKVPVTQPTP